MTLTDQMISEGAGQLWWSPDDAAATDEAKAVLSGSLPVLASHIAAHAPRVMDLVTCADDSTEALTALASAVAEAVGPPLPGPVAGHPPVERMIHAGAAALQAHSGVAGETDKAVLVLRAALPMLAEQIRVSATASVRLGPRAAVQATVSQVTDLAEQVRPY